MAINDGYTARTARVVAKRTIRFLLDLLRRASKRVSARALSSPSEWGRLLRSGRNEWRRLCFLWRGAAGPAGDPVAAYVRNNTIQPHVRALLDVAVRRFARQPTVSVVMPVYNAHPDWLRAAIESVRSQIYPHWELCIADDASTIPDTRAVLDRYENAPRMRIVRRSQNGGISRASNDAAAVATGDHLVLLDQDDLLAPHALFEIARLLQRHPEADVIYSDEDKIDLNDRHYDLHFKPDWSPVLLLGYNYVNHLTCIRRSLFEAVGGFRSEYDGAQDYDLLLRVTEITSRVHHIPKVLYHWRAAPHSVATRAGVKPQMQESVAAALRDALRRRGVDAHPYRPEFAAAHQLPIYQLDWPDEGPPVEIFVAARSPEALLCVQSLLARTTYRDYRVSLVGERSADIMMDLRVPTAQRVRAVQANCLIDAAAASQAEYVFFLDARLDVAEPRWLSRLVGYATLPGVGAAGGRILSDNGRILHAGTVLGLEDGRTAGDAFGNHPSERVSYFFLAETVRECSAVSGACLLTRRELLCEMAPSSKAFPDFPTGVQYCLEIEERGLTTVCVPGADLVCRKQRSAADRLTHGARSVPATRREDQVASLSEIWIDRNNRRDPYYNPNLSVWETFVPGSVCTLDYADYRNEPLRVAWFTHNLNLEGAPGILVSLVEGLEERGKIRSRVVSFADGPLRGRLERGQVPVRVVEPSGSDNILKPWPCKEDYVRSRNAVRELLEAIAPDVVVASVVNSFFVVNVAAQLGIPSLWVIRENHDRAALAYSVTPFAYPDCERAFEEAYRVVFDSRATEAAYSSYDRRSNFATCWTGIRAHEIDSARARWTREEARRSLGVAPGEAVVLTVGTICERKDQITLVQAVEVLARQRGDFRAFLVGARRDVPDTAWMEEAVKSRRLEDRVCLVAETEQVHLYYRAADVFVLTSLNESYPVSVLEAMAHGLPIITTRCGGVTEQVRFGLNAFEVGFRDVTGVASCLARLLDDEHERLHMGSCSRALFGCLRSYEDMLDDFERMIAGAWQVGASG